ncbi:hypothetical protein AKJ59_00600 [candidate division MSBL1 archaeon SCGC-AAA385M02]|uniref:Uncharacterized protein n=1 Tax=candidate division MSBL1 archaeon SCGC-AAA385M02 TaxID=1698287 RepID=A0A133VQL9_9EURY|nr:hypothetical protein AKJ59_00600 [candidate division MSBL1 archaeon SCGC-AAA385M02]
MIIFYEKKTGRIFGVINGRKHDDNAIENTWLQPGNLKKSEVGKYIVPFKTKYKMVKEPITELRVVDQETMKVEKVKVGEKEVKQSAGMEPDVPFADLVLDFESGKKDIYDYKIKLKNGKVVGFEKK